MKNIAKSSEEVRKDLFINTASMLGIREAIVEKDFWVCWMLDIIFHELPFKDYFAFKGGTSLSKGYGLIERFSEDIDLILDCRCLGYQQSDLWIKRSISAQNTFNKKINGKTAEFISQVLMPSIQQKGEQELKT